MIRLNVLQDNAPEYSDYTLWKKGLNPYSIACGVDFKKCCKKYKKGKRCKKCPDR